MITRSQLSRLRGCQRLYKCWRGSLRPFSLPPCETKVDSEPLRILFCGGDEFSVASLRALQDEAKSGLSNIASIDVVTKTDQATGRGGKVIWQPAIKAVAKTLGLPTHQIDTFTGWSPPEYGTRDSPYINLIIAVSFGLKVPPRILNQTKYGGLNIHPSLLPKLRGPAPIQWSIINGLVTTGISLQTLHPSQFDAGVVLDQTPLPGIAIPNPTTCDYIELRDFLAPLGAEILVKAIRSGLYKPPHNDVTRKYKDLLPTFAPKIRTDLKQIDFDSMDVNIILRRNRAIPRLWAIAESTVEGKSVRIIFGTDIRVATAAEFDSEIRHELKEIEPGRPYSILKDDQDMHSAPIFINAKYGRTLCVPTLVAAGSSSLPAATAATRGHLFGDVVQLSGYRLHLFHRRLKLWSPKTLDTTTALLDNKASI